MSDKSVYEFLEDWCHDGPEHRNLMVRPCADPDVCGTQIADHMHAQLVEFRDDDLPICYTFTLSSLEQLQERGDTRLMRFIKLAVGAMEEARIKMAFDAAQNSGTVH